MTFVTRMTSGAAIGAAMLVGLSAFPVQAGYIVDLTQQGSNVVATGSGSIDLTGLTFLVRIDQLSLLIPDFGFIVAPSPPHWMPTSASRDQIITGSASLRLPTT
jgi:hypothetical protein